MSNLFTTHSIQPPKLYTQQVFLTRQRKKKNMNFIKKWFVNIGKKAYEDEEHVLRSDTIMSSQPLDGNPLRLNVYRATGGIVVQTSQYDSVKDRTNQQLHIVTHEQDLGENLAKIITMELLRG